MTRLKTLPPRISTIQTTIAPPPKEAEAFYLSPAWRRTVAEVIRERGRKCQDCGTTSGRIHCDHIVERKDGGADLDKANLRLRCSKCHAVKTARERANRFAR